MTARDDVLAAVPSDWARAMIIWKDHMNERWGLLTVRGRLIDLAAEGLVEFRKVPYGCHYMREYRRRMPQS